MEVILVDNASTDGSVEFVKDNFPDVLVFSLTENRGFSAAANAGIKNSRGSLIALLNNDTEADPHWLEELKRALDSHPDAGSAASRILFFQQRDRINSLGLEFHFDGTTADIAYGAKNSEAYNEFRFIFGACSAAALYRKSLFDDIGLFDEEFFAYGEDVDISFRAQLMGYKCIYVPRAVVYHHGSATGVRHSPFNEYHVRRNEVWVLAKNMPDELLMKYRWRMVYGQFKILLKSPILLFRLGSLRLFWARIRGKIEGFSNWNRFRKKGKKTRLQRRTSITYIEGILS